MLSQKLFKVFQEGASFTKDTLLKTLEISEEALNHALLMFFDNGLLKEEGDRIVPSFYYTPLDKMAIINALSSDVLHEFRRIETFLTLDSTSTYLKDKNHQNIDVCVSEMQTNGIGRKGKVWQSPLAKNLYVSLRVTIEDVPMQTLTAFSPLLGLVLAKYFREKNIPVSVKWPNDLWLNGKKIAGILIDIISQDSKKVEMIIGIGMNIHKGNYDLLSEYQATTIENEMGFTLNRNLLLADILNKIYTLKQNFQNHSIQRYLDDWHLYSVFNGQKIRLNSGNKVLVGREINISANGALLIEDECGKIVACLSGDSLRLYD